MTGEIQHNCEFCGKYHSFHALYGSSLIYFCKVCGTRNRINLKTKDECLAILDSLTEALGTSEGQSTEEIKEDLRNDGMDVNNAVSRLKERRKEISEKSRRHYG